MQSPVLIGIAGGSGSGKTALCRRIIEESSLDLVLVCQDAYYKDLSHLSMEERNNRNFDHPDAFDNDLLSEHLSALKHRKPIQIPEYDFVTHTRTGKFQMLYPNEFILLEGIMLFSDPTIRDLCDYKIYMDIEPDIRFIRRLERDIKERGRNVGSVIKQYLSTVRPMHLEFSEPTKKYADIIFNGKDLGYLVKSIIKHIESIRFKEANK